MIWCAYLRSVAIHRLYPRVACWSMKLLVSSSKYLTKVDYLPISAPGFIPTVMDSVVSESGQVRILTARTAVSVSR